jgi:hypothetical protein
MRTGTSDVAEQPLLASECEEEIFRDMKLIPLGDLDGPSFDESSAFQSVHGMAGEMSGAAGLHFEAKVAWAEAGAESFEIDDRKGHHFIGGQIVGDCSLGRWWQERNVSLELRFWLRGFKPGYERR